mgnify:CR=1 FL=1
MRYAFTMKTLADNIFETVYASALLERFLRYVQIYSESSSEKADSGVMPSTEQQKDLAKVLNQELSALGLKDVQTTPFCYTYGFLPASAGCENVPSFCVLAHIDTVEEVTGKDVKPQVVTNYDGSPIKLPYGITLDPALDKDLVLAGKERDTIISSDGSTLLGADDKAGVAEIMTMLEYLVTHPEVKHGAIEVIFSPDEETGHGMDKVPLNLIKSKMAYTVDGGHRGELETECFNAYKSEVVFTGKSKHTGSARPDMVNAINIAAAFVASLPHHEMPETTDGYAGFYAPMGISGSVESSNVTLLLRDFTSSGMEKRKSLVDKLANAIAESFGGKATVTHTQQYLNMKEVLDKNPQVVEKLVSAYKAAGISPVFTPIRGGTDGSRLTEMGIPTPNIFTGGHLYHSRYEWASFSQMIQATEVLIQLAQSWV